MKILNTSFETIKTTGRVKELMDKHGVPGATMAVIMLSIIPIIVVYMFAQKHIIKGVAAGAVKG